MSASAGRKAISGDPRWQPDVACTCHRLEMDGHDSNPPSTCFKNATYFTQSTESTGAAIPDGSSSAVVQQVVVDLDLLGEKALRDASVPASGSVFEIYLDPSRQTLSEVLLVPPMPPRAPFWWERLGKLETGAFPVAIQARFLTVIYARVLGVMGPDDRAVGPGSIMTSEDGPELGRFGGD
ncbi:hypothetical protein C8R45DRAFT_939438 [Mycena sanguinolenta]|nr:hypothetical protein C8R45DRAFT_939438 [Mycena sanguinolenta]